MATPEEPNRAQERIPQDAVNRILEDNKVQEALRDATAWEEIEMASKIAKRPEDDSLRVVGEHVKAERREALRAAIARNHLAVKPGDEFRPEFEDAMVSQASELFMTQSHEDNIKRFQRMAAEEGTNPHVADNIPSMRSQIEVIARNMIANPGVQRDMAELRGEIEREVQAGTFNMQSAEIQSRVAHLKGSMADAMREQGFAINLDGKAHAAAVPEEFKIHDAGTAAAMARVQADPEVQKPLKAEEPFLAEDTRLHAQFARLQSEGSPDQLGVFLKGLRNSQELEKVREHAVEVIQTGMKKEGLDKTNKEVYFDTWSSASLGAEPFEALKAYNQEHGGKAAIAPDARDSNVPQVKAR